MLGTALLQRHLPLGRNQPAALTGVILTTRQGRQLTVRSATLHDYQLIVQFLEQLSDRSRWLRYFLVRLDSEALQREARRMLQANSGQHTLVLALDQGVQGSLVVAIGELALGADGVAEPAVVVSDAYQNSGIGTALVQLLARTATVRGAHSLRTELLGENYAMRRVMQKLGVPLHVSTHLGETTVLARL